MKTLIASLALMVGTLGAARSKRCGSSMRTLFLLAALFFVLSLGRAGAYSDAALNTTSNLYQLEGAIKAHHWNTGKYPSLNDSFSGLENYAALGNGDSLLTDQWGRKLVLLVPGKHGKFDLYSVGFNGIDEQGEGDDISNWAGIPDGYYYKRTWPMARLLLYSALPSALLCLIAGFLVPWRFVIPVAGIVLCAVLFGGCYFLMTPLHTTLNDLLSWASLGLIILFLAFMAALISAFRPRATLRQS